MPTVNDHRPYEQAHCFIKAHLADQGLFYACRAGLSLLFGLTEQARKKDIGLLSRTTRQ